MAEPHARDPRGPHGHDDDPVRRNIPTLGHTEARPGAQAASEDERRELTVEMRNALLSSLPPEGVRQFLKSFENALERPGMDQEQAWRLAWIDVQQYYTDPKDDIEDEVPPEFEVS